ncbi:MAG: M28 family peptidase [Desulfurivibrionaceae bacterium]|nr:M28 family peptidase [Desulfurivibrionaceae bacterium]
MVTSAPPAAQSLDDRSAIDNFLAERLAAHVGVLALEIGERNIRHPQQLARAAAYIEATWASQGYKVKSQEYTAEGVVVRNLEVEIKGARHPERIIIIGAHYDSVAGSPGANDNGSGVAVLLELSRRFRAITPEKTVRFVAFVNEEPPFFLSRRMGSRIYAARARRNNEQIGAMLSLETIGYYSDMPGSQRYPFPLRFFYPDRANFIGFVANLRSRKLLNRVADCFERNSAFPAERVAAPFWLTGIGWSDHWSFWREGYPAIMVTDTAFFRYDHYHLASDTPDRLAYEKMAGVADGLYRTIAELGGNGSGRQCLTAE